MKVCLVLCAILVCCSAQMYSVFQPPSPQNIFCVAEHFRRRWSNSIWIPSCSLSFSSWNIQQCDRRSRCWCVDRNTGQPIRWNPYVPTAAINCNDFMIACPATMVYEDCATCIQSCENMKSPRNCGPSCRPGCTCPSNTYWYGDRCVAASQCPTTTSQVSTASTSLTTTTTLTPANIPTTNSANETQVFQPPSPLYSFCLSEAYRRSRASSVWIPSCTLTFGWSIEQCDRLKRCWCVNRNGQPVRWNPYLPTAAINCHDFTIPCPANMVYDDCASCTQSCENMNSPQPCDLSCRPGCTCPPNTYLYENRCVAANECPQSSTITNPTSTPTTTTETSTSVCPETQVFSNCAGCSLRCVDRFNPPLCVAKCEARCTCPDGMFLDGERCVAAEDCPAVDPRCNATMVYSTCLGCVNTCSDRNDPILCPAVCMGEGCTCPPNTFLHEGRCLLEEQCPPVCPENQVYSDCASACENTCANRGVAVSCSLACLQKCSCPHGLLLHGQRCVEPSECPNETTSSVPSASITSQTTSASTSAVTTTTSTEPETTGQVCPENQIFSECTGCRLRCVDQFDPPLCSGGCSPGCTCPPGMLLDGDVCVSLEDCPAIDPRCNATMVYSTCLGCVNSCSDRNDPILCPAVCMGEGCTCPPNTFLHEGRCLLEEQCPPLCPENQVYSYCASACGNTCEDRNASIVCPLICLEQCTCPPGLYLDGQRCVEASECPDTSCDVGRNEIYRTCAPPCDATCDDPNVLCSLQESCNRRCACPEGYLRNASGVCVLPLECLLRSRDSKWACVSCGNSCETLTLCQSQLASSEEGSALMCDEEGYFNTTQCTELECFCVNKYSGETLSGTTRLREFFDVNCAYLGDCPANMVYQFCSTACPSSCEEPVRRCTRQCAIDCSCTEGYVRLSSTNATCVPVESCPPDPSSCEYRQTSTTMGRYLNCDEDGGYKAKQCDVTAALCWCVDESGEIMLDLLGAANLTEEDCVAARACRKNEGMEYSKCARNCDPTCEDRVGECGDQPCTARCQCSEGLFYEPSAKMCVEAEFCPPPLPTCSEMRGEVFAPCAAPCDPTCDEPFPPCLASNSCSPRCACLSGRRRNANGVCVPPSECSPPLPPSTSSSETTTTPRVRSVSGGSGLPSDCNVTRTELLIDPPLDVFIPDCTADGYYKSTQCDGFLTECFCVNKESGIELVGSRANQFNPDYDIDCNNYAVPPPPPPPPVDDDE